MMAELKAEANRAAQESVRAMVAYMVKHGGRRNPLLEDAYRAAERVVDAVEEYESFARIAEQDADPEAPDYAARWTEGEYQFGWGK